MMNNSEEFLEKVWDGILSRDSVLISKTFSMLDKNSKKVVLDHLKKMVNEEGWHPEQVISATVALTVLKEYHS